MVKGNTYFLLIGAAVIYLVLVFLLQVFHVINVLMMFLLFALLPLVLVNIFILKSDTQTRLFKGIVVVVSVFFLAGYCYYIWTNTTEQKPFGAKEFGVLLYDNISNTTRIRINKKTLKRMLEHIRPRGSNLIQSVRVELSEKSYEFFHDPKLAASFILNELNEYRGSVGVLFHKIVGNKVHSKLYIAPGLRRQGFPKDTVSFATTPDQLPQVLRANVESIVRFKKGLAAATDQPPKTKVDQIITSNQIYQEGTRILRKALDIKINSSRRKQQLQLAEQQLRAAVKIDPGNDRSLAMLGYIKLHEESDYDSAAMFYEQARRIHPENPYHTMNLAVNYYHSGRGQEAIRILKEYLEKYGETLEYEYIKMEMERLISSYQKK